MREDAMIPPPAMPRLIAAFLFAAALAAYATLFGDWGRFAMLILAPDLLALGYLAGRKAGATLYNLGHNYSLPLVSIGWGMLAHASDFTAIGLIWIVHVAFDRIFGFGFRHAGGLGLGDLGMPLRCHQS